MPYSALVKMKKITVHQQSVVRPRYIYVKKIIASRDNDPSKEFVLGNGMSRTVQVIYSILVKLQVC